MGGQKIVICSLFRIQNNMIMCHHIYVVKNFCKVLPQLHIYTQCLDYNNIVLLFTVFVACVSITDIIDCIHLLYKKELTEEKA